MDTGVAKSNRLLILDDCRIGISQHLSEIEMLENTPLMKKKALRRYDPDDFLPYEKQIELFNRYKQSGDVDAYQQLLMEYIRLAHSIADAFRLNPLRDDLKQEAVIALAEAIDRWDPSRGRLTTIATRIIRQRLGKIVTRVNHVYLTKKEQLKDELGDDKENVDSPVIQEASFDLDLEEVKRRLSYLNESDREIILSRFGLGTDATTYSGIAIKLNISRSAAESRFRQLMRFLKDPPLCRWCKQPYIKSTRSVYCSETCRFLSKLYPLKFAVCKCCNKVFVSDHRFRSYCSLRCRFVITVR